MEQEQQLLMNDTLAQGQLPPTHIFDGLTVFNEKSEYASAEEYLSVFERFVEAFPNMAHVIGGIGEPLSGKLSVVTEMMNLVTCPGSRLQRFAKQNGYKIQKYLLTWGEPFNVIPNRNLPDNMSWREKSRLQTPHAVPIFFDSLAATIAGYDKQTFSPRSKILRLIGYDAVPHTGIKIDDEEYGLVRANEEMRELATHRGRFNGLEYCDWRFGIAASNKMRFRNLEFRNEILAAQTEEERYAILMRWNKEVKMGENGKITNYADDEASAGNVAEIEDEMNELTHGLVKHGFLDLSKYKDFGDMRAPTDLSLSGDMHVVRDLIIGGEVNPLMFQLSQANPAFTTYFYNSKDSGESVLDLEGYKSPVRDLYYPAA